MEKNLYFLLVFFSALFPFLLSFYSGSEYFKVFKKKIPYIVFVGFLFIIHDMYFTSIGVWSFNSRYLLGYNIFNLPIEEWLFFICIPFASLFMHSTKETFHPKWVLSLYLTRLIGCALIVSLSLISILSIDNIYTLHSFGLAALLIVIGLIYKISALQSFFVSYLFILLPFLIVNGILTGAIITDEVVWYDNSQNLGLRIGTIPVEDIFYGFSLLFGPLLLSNLSIEINFLKKT